MFENVKVHKTQGGDELVVESGGKITIKAGGELDVQDGATLNLADGIHAPEDIGLSSGKIIVGDGSDLGAAVTPSGDLAMSNAGAFTIGAVVNGARVANVVEAQVLGGVPVVHVINIPDAVTGNVDVVLTDKTRILDVIVLKTAGAGGSGDLITVKNGATAITNDIDINIADKVVSRAGTIDDAQYEIAAAGTLRITRTKASANNTACKVIVIGMRVA